MKFVAIALLAGAACLAGFPAISAEPDYVDDRSDAASVLRSLYNAVSRREYARAWDYFGDTRPAASFDDFVDGYRTTERVDIETGAVSQEGAAGSVFFSVPVAIRATATDGSAQVFAGCYTLRQVNAQVQEPPFRPILIEKGRLEPSSAQLAEAVPASCGDGPQPPPRDAILEQAKAAFDAAYGDRCSPPSANGAAAGPQAFALGDRDSGAGADAAGARLFRFSCSTSAYNEDSVYYLHDEIGGLRQLQFATPELDIHYAGDGQEEVEAVNVVGFRASDRLANSDYDEATMTIRSHAKWRGVGDASEAGAWLFRNGDFALVRYEVDASWDGEPNPETVLDYETPP
jgi:hypothetical protein